MARDGDSPIFVKSYDFLLWLLNTTEKFPKSERFRLGNRLEDAAFAFHETLIAATRTHTPLRLLFDADLQLDHLRLYVRLSHARGLLRDNQYQFVSERLIELGKLLGGWIKSQSAAPQTVR